jgi:hypothetical protein
VAEVNSKRASPRLRSNWRVGPTTLFDAKVISCYEAGRDGFWLDRFLGTHGVENLAVDSASIVRRSEDRLRLEKLTDAVSKNKVVLVDGSVFDTAGDHYSNTSVVAAA